MLLLKESTLRGQVDAKNGEITFATLGVLELKEAAFEDGGNAQQTTGIFSAPPMSVRNKQLFAHTDLATDWKIMFSHAFFLKIYFITFLSGHKIICRPLF